MTYGVMRLSRGLPESARTRRSTLVFHLLYVVAFIISWGPHLASTFVDVAPHVLLGLDAATYSTQVCWLAIRNAVGLRLILLSNLPILSDG